MILIIGSGLSGLTLARYLHNHDVPFRIFDQATDYRPQGYGLTLRYWIIDKLLSLLGISSEQDFRAAVAVDRKEGVMSRSLLDISTGEPLTAGSFSPEYARDFRANRARLRELIRGQVNVTYGHKLVDVRTLGEGDGKKVEAVFANGVRVEGDMLVAADGIHSYIRRSLLPQHTPQDFEGVFFNGIRHISLNDYTAFLQPHMQSSNVQPGFGDNFLIATTVYDTDPINQTVSLSWGFSRPSRGPTDPLFVPYSPTHRSEASAPEQLWKELDQLPKPLAEPFKFVFQGTEDIRKDSTLHQLLVTLVVPKEDLNRVWDEKKVVFVGDAVHAWSNHAGTGGNHAVLDALDLGRILRDAGNKSKKLDVNGGYYEDACERWKNAAKDNNKDYVSLHRSKEDWNKLRETLKEKL